MLNEAGDYENALVTFKNIMDRKPADPISVQAYGGMGKALLELGKSTEAIDAYTKAIKLSGSHADANLYLDRSKAYMAQKDEKNSLADVQKAVETAPGKIYVLLTLADKYMNSDMEMEAIATLDKAKELDPDLKGDSNTAASASKRSLFYNTMASLMVEIGDYDKAKQNYVKALKADPTLPEKKKDFLLDWGWACYMTGDKKEAAVNVDKWLKNAPPVKNEEDLESRAMAMVIKGDSKSALNSINNAIKLDPDNAGPYTTRGVIYESMGDDAKALSDYQTAISKSKKDADKERAENHLTMLKKQGK
jgi:tetratricopeptide (TPR) repeat protein